MSVVQNKKLQLHAECSAIAMESLSLCGIILHCENVNGELPLCGWSYGLQMILRNRHRDSLNGGTATGWVQAHYRFHILLYPALKK